MDCEQQRSALMQSVVHLLHRAGQLADESFETAMADMGLTPRQYSVLEIIGEQPGINQTKIAQASGCDRSTTTDLVRRLERKGWIQRRRVIGNARAFSVSLTPAGRSILERASPLARGVDAKIEGVLSVELARDLIQGLRSVILALDDEESASPDA